MSPSRIDSKCNSNGQRTDRQNTVIRIGWWPIRLSVKFPIISCSSFSTLSPFQYVIRLMWITYSLSLIRLLYRMCLSLSDESLNSLGMESFWLKERTRFTVFSYQDPDTVVFILLKSPLDFVIPRNRCNNSLQINSLLTNRRGNVCCSNIQQHQYKQPQGMLRNTATVISGGFSVFVPIPTPLSGRRTLVSEKWKVSTDTGDGQSEPRKGIKTAWLNSHQHLGHNQGRMPSDPGFFLLRLWCIRGWLVVIIYKILYR